MKRPRDISEESNQAARKNHKEVENMFLKACREGNSNLVGVRIYPKFSAFRILMGLIRSNSELMLAQTIAVWMAVLMFQNTLSGLDLTLKFEWLDCDGENATWVSGFEWDHC